MNAYDTKPIVMVANRNVRGTAVPAVPATNAPFSAIAAVGAIMATDIAMASIVEISFFFSAVPI